MQSENHNKIPDDEIDLSTIGQKIYSLLAYPVSLLIANIKTTLLFVALAVALAFSLKYTFTKTYKSSFIIRPLDIHEKFHIKIINGLHGLVVTHDLATLASELKITPEVASTITELSAINPNLRARPDSVNYTEVFITTSDYNQFIPIQNSLLAYLENNPYFAKIKVLERQQVDLALDQVNNDLPKLDSLKRLQLSSYGKQQVSSQNMLMLNELVNPTSVYAMAIERLDKKSSLMAQQVFSDNFQLIKSCMVVKHPNWPPRILVMCIYLIPCFLLLCIVFLHIKMRKQRSN